MNELKVLVPLLPVVLPLIGKLLLMIPFVPNKAVPAINAAIATAAKYWFLAGFGNLGEVPIPQPVPGVGWLNDHVLQAGFLGEFGRAGLSLAWGCLDQVAAHYFYEFKRKAAAEVGKVSWLEKGKTSMFGESKKR